MQSIPLNLKWEKIMVNVRALVGLLAVLWASSAQAVPLTFLDANFAQETVAQDLSGGNTIQFLTAKPNGEVWGGAGIGSLISKALNGNYESYSFPAPGMRTLEAKDNDTIYAGTHYVGSPAGSGKIYAIDNAGNSTEFVTLPINTPVVERIDVSPINGDVVVLAPTSGSERILKYNSAGVLQWNVASPGLGDLPISYTPSGELIAAGSDQLYSIDNITGAATQLPFSPPTEFVGTGVGFINDMVFSSDENLFMAVATGNVYQIVRMNILTGDSALLASWAFVIPPQDRFLDYVDGLGLYINDFDANDFESLNTFSLMAETSSVLLLQGEFNGEFSGLNALDTLAPEPSSVWLLLGLLAWKRKKLVRNSPPETVDG